MNVRGPRPYADASRSGIVLGVLLLATFVVEGRGLGASGAFAVAAGDVVGVVAPNATAADSTLADRLPAGINPFGDWILLEIVGVFAGAALSARLTGRSAKAEEPVARARLARALAGGGLMGLGARLAYGCTSGLALSGGALLATGAWIFIPLAFGTAVLVSLLARERRGHA